MRKSLLVLLGISLMATAAYADYFEGTISDIDHQTNKLGFTRTDNGERVEVEVRDQTALNLAKAGSPVRIQADKGLTGKWIAKSIQVPQDQLNVPDQALLNSNPAALEQPKAGMSASESISSNSNKTMYAGTEVTVRQRGAY